MTVPERRRRTDRPLYRQAVFWLGVALFVAMTGTGIATIVSTVSANDSAHALRVANDEAKQRAALAKTLATETLDREKQLRAVICGVYVPLGRAPLSAATSQLGHTLVTAAHTAAVLLKCPGA